MSLRQLSTDSSNDDGGGDSSGVRCTSSMTAYNSSRSTDMAGSSRMDNNRIRIPDNQLRFRLLQRQPLPERSNAARVQEVIQLPPMQ